MGQDSGVSHYRLDSGARTPRDTGHRQMPLDTMLPFGGAKVGSGVRIGRRGEKLNLVESSSILKVCYLTTTFIIKRLN